MVVYTINFINPTQIVSDIALWYNSFDCDEVWAFAVTLLLHQLVIMMITWEPKSMQQPPPYTV
jgi:hypothetical protein